MKERSMFKTAIYGYSILTECLIYELNGNDIEISFLIDRNADNLSISFPKYKLDEAPLNNVNHILIMPVDNYEIIKRDLQEQMNNSGNNGLILVTFEDLIYEL